MKPDGWYFGFHRPTRHEPKCIAKCITLSWNIAFTKLVMLSVIDNRYISSLPQVLRLPEPGMVTHKSQSHIISYLPTRFLTYSSYQHYSPGALIAVPKFCELGTGNAARSHSHISDQRSQVAQNESCVGTCLLEWVERWSSSRSYIRRKDALHECM